MPKARAAPNFGAQAPPKASRAASCAGCISQTATTPLRGRLAFERGPGSEAWGASCSMGFKTVARPAALSKSGSMRTKSRGTGSRSVLHILGHVREQLRNSQARALNNSSEFSSLTQGSLKSLRLAGDQELGCGQIQGPRLNGFPAGFMAILWAQP